MELPKGFQKVSGKRSPSDPEREYTVMFRNGFVDWKTSYTASQMIWIHSGSSWDIIAVKDASNG